MCRLPSSGGWKSEIKVSAGLASPSFWWLAAILVFPWLLDASPHLCLHAHVAFSLCACVYVQISPFCKDTGHIGDKPILFQYNLILT